MSSRLHRFLEEIAGGPEVFPAVEAILDSDASPIVVTDLEDTIILANAAACSLLGRSARELENKHVEVLASKLRESMDGELRVLARPIRSLDGRVCGRFHTFESLESTSDETEIELLRRRLVQIEGTNAEMKTLETSRNNILSNVSHELRTPLVTIIGYVEMISNRELGEANDEITASMKVVLRNALRLSSRIDDLLNLSRLQEETITPVMEAFSMGQVIDSLLPEYRLLIEDKELEVKTSLPPDLPLVRADRRLAAIAVENLLKNAISFSDRQGTISIDLQPNEHSVLLRIADEGPGVPVNQLDLVFDPFHQADPSPTRNYGGIGLGLAIVRRIVDAHGGRVWLESDGEHGTTACLELPIATQPDAR